MIDDPVFADEDDDDHGPAWAAFRQQIDQRLDKARPERAGVGDREWREKTYGWARNHIPDETNLVRHFAEQEVDRREGQATKRGNKLLRRWMHGQAPLSWDLVGPLPVKVGNVRVRLDAATPEDIEDAARDLQAQGLATWNEIVLLCQSLRDLARQARQSGYVTVAKLGDLPPRGMSEAA